MLTSNLKHESMSGRSMKQILETATVSKFIDAAESNLTVWNVLRLGDFSLGICLLLRLRLRHDVLQKAQQNFIKKWLHGKEEIEKI